MVEVVERMDIGRASALGPVYLLLFPIVVVCFVGALATDVAYAASAFLMWLHFSEWLIAAGLAFGALAAVVLLVECFASPTFRATRVAWAHLGLFFVVLIVELVNAFVHTIDGWTAVVPGGLVLSVIASVVALAAVWALFLVPITWVARRRVGP
jgi:uncharacterized membrane protein